jgi:hypothetical protein
MAHGVCPARALIYRSEKVVQWYHISSHEVAPGDLWDQAKNRRIRVFKQAGCGHLNAWGTSRGRGLAASLQPAGAKRSRLVR